MADNRGDASFNIQVALLFLTRMGIPYEAVWKAFLESVPNFGGQGDSWMLLFNIYVHPPPNVVLHDSSIFKNYQMPWDQRVAVEWGQWSVVSNPLLPHITHLRVTHVFPGAEEACMYPCHS